MNTDEKSLKLHEDNRGKIEMKSKVPVKTREDLSLAYTPGVAAPCKKIEQDIENVYKYTSKGNTVAVVTDGSAVLGLGDIGASASIPVMEGKCILFKEFADIDAIPICIDSNDVDTIVETVKLISPTLGGINLEDISAPRCFEVEDRLKRELDIPVFHDDQHGTAIVVLAGLINSARLLKKDIKLLSVVINGSGSAGIAICKLLLQVGITDIVVCDRIGAILEGREQLNDTKVEIAQCTNPNGESGKLVDVIANKDVFIGVSAPDVLSTEMVKSMNIDPIVFALSNPVPEIMPEVAKDAGAKIVATGRSDFPNQINNVLAFPGIFKGALEVRRQITDDMKLAAAYAIANIIDESELNEDNIIPGVFDPRVMTSVYEAVKNTK